MSPSRGPSYVALALAAGLLAGCASLKIPPLDVTPPEVIAARLADADGLASRGCYLCLKDAAAVYHELIGLTADVGIMQKAVENDLLIALREIELRMPDSGARLRAEGLRQHLKATYTPYFSALDIFGKPLDDRRTIGADVQQLRAERKELAAQLSADWAASPMKAYFYVAAAIGAGQGASLREQLDGLLAAHPDDLALKYRLQAYPQTSSDGVSKELLGREPRFGEVHYLIGQRAMFGGAMVTAHRELTAAHTLLPDSAMISMTFGTVELAFSRFAEALALFDRVLATDPDDAAKLGRAKALSYLRRYQEAVGVLDELLQDVRTNPGEKYYWRAWNRLQLGLAQPAYEDATTMLKSMVNIEAYRLAGIASFTVSKLDEARLYFDSALKMHSGDCDSLRYLGQIDSMERKWPASVGRFTAASACYSQAIVGMTAELAQKEADTSGLMAGHVASLRASIKEAEALQATCSKNAAIVSKNLPAGAR
jgi:tetratricopeptide (TPR) repeat protein